MIWWLAGKVIKEQFARHLLLASGAGSLLFLLSSSRCWGNKRPFLTCVMLFFLLKFTSIIWIFFRNGLIWALTFRSECKYNTFSSPGRILPHTQSPPPPLQIWLIEEWWYLAGGVELLCLRLSGGFRCQTFINDSYKPEHVKNTHGGIKKTTVSPSAPATWLLSSSFPLQSSTL